jgi:hypothetical protein
MSRYNRIPSTVVVTPLDLSDVEESAAEYLTKHREVDGKSAVTKTSTGHTWGIVETPHGIYALCTEGVGPDHPITDEKPLTVELWVREYADTEQDFISMFPACSQKLRPDDLRERATGEPVPLEDFIRTFGGRLEANYSGWRVLLEKALEVPA